MFAWLILIPSGVVVLGGALAFLSGVTQEAARTPVWSNYETIHFLRSHQEWLLFYHLMGLQSRIEWAARSCWLVEEGSLCPRD